LEINHGYTTMHSQLIIKITYRSSGFQTPAKAIYFYVLRNVQNGSGVHTASCSMDSGGSDPGVKWPWRDVEH